MRFKKIASALFACLALGAFAANSAQATEGDGWTIDGSGLIKNNIHQGVNCTKHSNSTLLFTGILLGLPVKLEAANIDCLKEKGAVNPATIDNTTSKGHSEGVLTFTTVKVLEPSTKCTVGNVASPGAEEFTTEQLTDLVIMDPSGGSVAFDKFFPEVSGGALFVIEFGGAECPLAGAAASARGSACGQFSSGTTVLATQTLAFGAAQQTTGGCALMFGTKPAGLSGEVDVNLAGSPSVGFGPD